VLMCERPDKLESQLKVNVTSSAKLKLTLLICQLVLQIMFVCYEKLHFAFNMSFLHGNEKYMKLPLLFSDENEYADLCFCR